MPWTQSIAEHRDVLSPLTVLSIHKAKRAHECVLSFKINNTKGNYLKMKKLVKKKINECHLKLLCLRATWRIDKDVILEAQS